MSSVLEMKSALLEDREALAEVASLSISSIDAMLNFSMLVLGILSVLIAIFSIIGIVVLLRQARKKAEQVANRKVDDYINTTGFAELIESKIADAIDKRWQSTVVLSQIDVHTRANNTADEFPSPNGGTKP